MFVCAIRRHTATRSAKKLYLQIVRVTSIPLPFRFHIYHPTWTHKRLVNSSAATKTNRHPFTSGLPLRLYRLDNSTPDRTFKASLATPPRSASAPSPDSDKSEEEMPGGHRNTLDYPYSHSCIDPLSALLNKYIFQEKKPARYLTDEFQRQYFIPRLVGSELPYLERAVS